MDPPKIVLDNPVTDKNLYDEYIKLRATGVRHNDALRQLSFAYGYKNPKGVAGQIARYKSKELKLPEPQASTFHDIARGMSAGMVYNGEPHFDGDVVVVSDVHVPSTNWSLCSLVNYVGRHERIKTLAIVGDLFNMDSYSTFASIVPHANMETEMSFAESLIGFWLSWFDRIIYVMGNHEHRLLHVAGGQISAERFQRMIFGSNAKVETSLYSHLWIQSGSEKWLATHQKNYNRTPGKVAEGLSAFYSCNIITAHQHMVSKSIDSSGRFTLIDNGGLFDESKMSYVNIRQSTSRRMASGFSFIRNGFAELVTPYPSFTSPVYTLELRRIEQDNALQTDFASA